ncbi:MAG: hypothetical protein GXO90_01850 [FCB group bacterium]|nr:hypothetical protein [FCB group bacterium]
MSLLTRSIAILFLGTLLLAGEPENFRWLADTPSDNSVTLPELNDGYGVIFRDFNGDDYPDLYLVRFRNLNRLLIYDPQAQTWIDRTIKSGLGGNLFPGGRTNLELSATLVDMDNDGISELMMIGWGATTQRFRQDRPLHFRSGGTEKFAQTPIDGNMGVWADVDRDGDLDVFITDEHYGNHLFLQNEQHQFVNRSREWQVTGGKAVSQGAAFGDLNADGWPDLYVCNWFAADSLYLNQHGSGFTALSLPIPHLQQALNSNSVTLADLDRDGWSDLIVCDRNGHTAVYRNLTDPEGNLNFADVTREWNIINSIPSYGAVVGDLNRDGRTDIFFTNLGPNLLFTGEPNGSFRLAWEEKGNGYYSTGAALADLNLDGDLDLVVSNKDTSSQIFINPVSSGHWLEIIPEGVRSNREAIGATVEIWDSTETRRIHFQEISSGMGYLSQSDKKIFVGIPYSGNVNVIIRYPTGIVRKASVHTDQRIFLPEISGLERSVILAGRQLKNRLASTLFWANFFRIFLAVGILAAFFLLAARRYGWALRPMVMTLFVLAILLYLVTGLIASPTAEKVLKTILNGEGISLFLLVISLEQYHRLSRKKAGVRQTLERFSSELPTVHDNHELAERLVAVCCEQLKLRQCGLWLKEAGGFALYASRNLDENCWKDVSQDRFHATKSFPFETVLPLKHNNTLEGYWAFTGSTERHWKLDRDDMALFRILADTAALAIQNNRYIEQVRDQERRLTQQEIREKMITELEAKNRELETLYRELKEAQTQLVHQEKMSALGQLVAGIAHELNNPIGIMYSNLKALDHLITTTRSGLSLPEDAREMVADIMEGSVRVRDLVQDLRNFSRLDEAQFKIADIHEGLDSTLTLLRGEFKGRITVHKDYGDLPELVCLPGHLNQVFLNILMNASQAMGASGEIWIRTWQEQEQIVIRFRDTGPGISEEVKDRLFEPFVTTKPVGKGTGLGLSISYGIILRHGGTIVAENWDRGSQFTIHLPLNLKVGEPT